MNQSNKSSSDGSEHIPMYVIYVVQGSVTGFTNLLIAVCIVRYKALRRAKTFIIVAALSLSDWFDQMAFFCGGIYRLSLIVRGIHNKMVPVWDCFIPQNWLWWWSNQISNLMLVVVSFDRLIAVAKPINYLKLTRWYALGMVFACYGVCLAFGIGSMLFVYNADPIIRVPAVCSPIGTLGACAPDAWVFVHGSVPQIWGVASVLVYVVVWYLYKKHVAKQVHAANGNPSTNTNDSYTKRQHQRQQQLTETLAISSLCTLLFAVFPQCVGYGLYAIGNQKKSFGLYLASFIMSNLNPLCNFFIYALRHKEIKLALKGLFTGKQMPDSLDLWNHNVQAKVVGPTGH